MRWNILLAERIQTIDNLKRVANYILLLRFINNYIFTGKDTQMKTHINTMASAITGVMGMPQTDESSTGTYKNGNKLRRIPSGITHIIFWWRSSVDKR